jgi:hypothetical protein
VTFDGVSSDRMAEMQKEMAGSERPEGVPAKEIVVLHDPENDKSLAFSSSTTTTITGGATKRSTRCPPLTLPASARQSRNTRSLSA